MAGVFCKPETRQDVSFGAGQSPATADSNRRRRGEGAISRLTDTSLLPLKQKQLGETKRAQGLGGRQKFGEQYRAGHAGAQRDGGPGLNRDGCC